MRSTAARPWRTKLLATAMAAVSLITIAPVHGDPADIFGSSAPAIGAAAPAATEIADGDASVSTKTGALTYSYPIKVPPGRNGRAPRLALTYSSQAPIYGGIAAGWSLSGIDLISRDVSDGLLAGSPRYQSSLAGNRPLVQVTEPSTASTLATFRAKNDSSWTRYEQVGESPTSAKWRAFSPDGTTFYFGETAHGTCPAFTTSYAPLTRTLDKFGNLVEYFYKPGPLNECHIDFITWGSNSTNTSLQHFAVAKFNYVESP